MAEIIELHPEFNESVKQKLTDSLNGLNEIDDIEIVLKELQKKSKKIKNISIIIQHKDDIRQLVHSNMTGPELIISLFSFEQMLRNVLIGDNDT